MNRLQPNGRREVRRTSRGNTGSAPRLSAGSGRVPRRARRGVTIEAAAGYGAASPTGYARPITDGPPKSTERNRPLAAASAGTQGHETAPLPCSRPTPTTQSGLRQAGSRSHPRRTKVSRCTAPSAARCQPPLRGSGDDRHLEPGGGPPGRSGCHRRQRDVRVGSRPTSGTGRRPRTPRIAVRRSNRDQMTGPDGDALDLDVLRGGCARKFG